MNFSLSGVERSNKSYIGVFSVSKVVRISGSGSFISFSSVFWTGSSFLQPENSAFAAICLDNRLSNLTNDKILFVFENALNCLMHFKAIRSSHITIYRSVLGSVLKCTKIQQKFKIYYWLKHFSISTSAAQSLNRNMPRKKLVLFFGVRDPPECSFTQQ